MSNTITTNSNNVKQFYLQALGLNIDGTFGIGNFISDSIEITHAQSWQIQIILNDNNGDSTVSLEQSSDNLTWDTLVGAENILVQNSVTFESNYFSGRYLRLVHSTTSTTGTIKTVLTQKG